MSPPLKFVQPKSDTIYRIRNVDTGLYLERGILSDPQMRPEKTSKRQHWRFILVDSTLPVTYRIADPYPGDNQPVVALAYNFPNLITAEPIQGSAHYNTWIFQNQGAQENATYMIASQNPRGTFRRLLGNTIPSPVVPIVGFVTIRTKANELPNEDIDFQWEFLEVSPSSLPEGENSKFRIRAFLGKPLQVDKSGDVNLDQADARGEHRVWTITELGNGRCTIFHEQAKKFLTAVNKGGFNWQPALKSENDAGFTLEDKIWIFERTSAITYAIFLSRLSFNNERRYFSLALEGNNTILKPKKVAHNQVWLVEPIDAPMDGPSPGSPLGPTAPPISTGPPAPTGPPALTGPPVPIGPTAPTGPAFPPSLQPNRWYRIRNPDYPNIDSPSHLQIAAIWNGSMLIGYAVVTGGSAANPADCKIEAKGSGVVLYAVYLGLNYYLGVKNGLVVTNQLNSNDNAYVWAVTQLSQEANGGRYLISAENNQSLTSPTSGTELALVDRNLQDSKQIWAFT